VRTHPVLARLARARVPLGFVFAAVCFWLATPTPSSIGIGMALAAAGEALRIWAAGHLEKGREVTRSGPYRSIRHPLYAGSTIMAAGFAIASRSLVVTVLVAAYLATTLFAAIRTEEATLDARFAGEYSAYRAGNAAPVARAFSLRRVLRNREHRAAAGLLSAAALLAMRWYFGQR
jgi:protein-S-isoprenylcysteine O-methyltransferase Ste14